jgi:hypothetical protein
VTRRHSRNMCFFLYNFSTWIRLLATILEYKM